METAVNSSLSVDQKHELLLKLEDAGLDESLAERVINSEGTTLGKAIVALIRDSSPVAQRETLEALLVDVAVSGSAVTKTSACFTDRFVFAWRDPRPRVLALRNSASSTGR